MDVSENNVHFGPFLKNSFGDRYLYEVNGITFNQIGAADLYDNHFGDWLLKETQLYFIIGTDSGLLVEYLRNKQRSDSSRYIFVEIEPVLKRLEQEGILAELPEDFAVVSLENLWKQANDFKFRDYIYVNSIHLVNALCSVDGSLLDYFQLKQVVEDNLRRRKNNIVAEIGLSDFAERQLENLAENRNGGMILMDQFVGKTAVLLAGGPSLDDILPWVIDNREKLVVLAVSRISKQLLKYDFYPDFVFSVDPQSTSFDVSREMLQMWDRAIFVHAYHASPRLVGQWAGRSIYLGLRFPWQSPLNQENLIVGGPTVTNTALNIAIAMGFSQVVFAGVDLCYADNGITHAGGSNESVAGPRLGDTLSVPTNDGNSAETGVDYASAIVTLSGQAQLATQHGCRFINPTARAAKIDGVDHVPLDEITLEPLGCDPLAHISALLAKGDDKQLRLEHYRAMLEELERADTQIIGIAGLAEKALSINEKFFRPNSKKHGQKIKGRFEKIEERLNGEFSNLSAFVKMFGIRKFLKIVRPNSDSPDSHEETEEVIRIYYQSYLDSARELREKLKNAADRIRMRIEEEATHPDFVLLAAQWRADRQPGRSLVWLRQHPQAEESQSQEDRQLFESLAAEFKAILAETETGQMKKVRKFRSLAGVLGKALRYFRAKDAVALARLEEGLAIHPSRAVATVFGAFVKGFRAELAGNDEEAVGHYQDIVESSDDFNHLTEEALKRILAINLRNENLKGGLLVLEFLASAIPIYKPKYAELLRICGSLMDAADVYTEYLEEVPSDFSALIKLGQLYRTMGEEQAAQQVFGLILDQDPENSAAKTLMAAVGN